MDAKPGTSKGKSGTVNGHRFLRRPIHIQDNDSVWRGNVECEHDTLVFKFVVDDSKWVTDSSYGIVKDADVRVVSS